MCICAIYLVNEKPYVPKIHAEKPRSGGIQRYLRKYALYSRNRSIQRNRNKIPNSQVKIYHQLIIISKTRLPLLPRITGAAHHNILLTARILLRGCNDRFLLCAYRRNGKF